MTIYAKDHQTPQMTDPARQISNMYKIMFAKDDSSSYGIVDQRLRVASRKKAPSSSFEPIIAE